jgi:Protein of unknown function (DUF2490)
MFKNLLILFLSLLLYLPLQIKADEQHSIDHVDSDLGLWPMVDITFPLYKDKVSGYIFALPIVIDADDEMNLNPLVLRGAVIAHPTKNISLWVGYDRNANLTHRIDFNEHRIWQQISHRHNFKNFDRLTFNQRFRVEERFLEDIGTAIRLRYRAGAMLGLGKTKRWYLVGNNEILFYVNETPGREAGFSENRPFVGVGRKITPNVSFEVGWQPSLINSAGTKHDILRNYIVTYLSIRIPYKAPKKPKTKDNPSLNNQS